MNSFKDNCITALTVICVLLFFLAFGYIGYLAGIADGQNQMQKHMDAGLIRVKDDNSNTYYWVKVKQ